MRIRKRDRDREIERHREKASRISLGSSITTRNMEESEACVRMCV